MKKSYARLFSSAGCLTLVLTVLLSTTGLAGTLSFTSSSPYLTYAGLIRDGIDGLDGAFALAASPDGANVYIAAFQDNGLSVYSRDAGTGALTFLEFFQDGVGGVTAGALLWPSAVTVSQDGQNVYVASTGGNAVAVFDRNSVTGRLTFRERQTGMNLAGASWVTLSPAGDFVYVASTGTKMVGKGSVTRFTRDLATGALTSTVVYADGNLSGGLVIDGLFGASSVVVSPDGTNLYVSSSRDRTGAGDTSIVAFSRNPATGVLTFTQVLSNVDSLYSVSALTISPDGQFVYAGIAGDGLENGTRAGAMAVFQRTVPTGTLTLTNVYTDDVGGVTGLDKILAITLSPDGHHLYAAAKEDDALTLFARDETTGVLTYTAMYKDETGGLDGLDAVKSVIVSPDGQHVYTVGEYEDAVTAFSRDAGTGALNFSGFQRGSLTTGVNGLNGASGVAVSQDGQHIYATGMYDGAIAVFQRDVLTGGMSFVQYLRDDLGPVEGLAGAYAVTTSPDGQNVYVAAYYKNSVVTFSRNAGDGTLTFMNYLQDGIGGVAGLHGANSVEVSPDGSQVYVASQYDNAIATFNRDAGTGALTYAGMVQDGVGGVEGLTAVRNTAISSDGEFLYAAGFTDNVVSVFSRMVPTGTLTFTSVYTAPAGASGGPLLGGINSVALSPDGKFLYTAAMPAKAVVVFARNPDSGALTFVEGYQDHSMTGGTIDGLDGANAVTVSPGGTHVYVTTQTDNSLVVFSRDATTGKLAFVEVFKDGVSGVDGLYTPMALATGPEGAQVYVVSKNDDSLAAFNVSPAVDISGPTSGFGLTSYEFTAAVEPLVVTTPVTYTWTVDGALPLTHTAGLTDMLTASWSQPGTHMVSVTAVTATGLVMTDTHSIDIFVKTYMPIIGK